jgi:hypothetical protein
LTAIHRIFPIFTVTLDMILMLRVWALYGRNRTCTICHCFELIVNWYVPPL